MNARALSLSFLLCWGTILSNGQGDEFQNPVLDQITHERYSDVREDGVSFASKERTFEDDNEVIDVNQVNRQNSKLLQDDNWEGLNDILEDEKDLHQRVRREDSPIKLPSIIQNGFNLGKKIVDGAVGKIRTFIEKIKEKRGSSVKDIIKKPWEGLEHIAEKIPKPEGGPIATVGKFLKNGMDHIQDNVKNIGLGIGDKLKGKRDKRSIWNELGNTHGMQKVMKSGKATVAEALNGGAAIRKILAQAQAETSSAKAELYKKKFKSDVFENDLEDWMLLGTPMGSNVFNEAFQEPKHQTNDLLRPTSFSGKLHHDESIMSNGMGDINAESLRNDAMGIDIHELSDEKTVNIDRSHLNEPHGDYIGGHFNRHTKPHNRWTYEDHRPHVNIYRNNFDHKSRFGSPVIHSSTNALGNKEHQHNEGTFGAISNSNAHNPFAAEHNINNNVVIGHGNTNEVGSINAHGNENKRGVGHKFNMLRDYDSTQPSTWENHHNAAWQQDFKLFNDASSDNVLTESHRRPIKENQNNHGIPVETSANSQSAASASAHAAVNAKSGTEPDTNLHKHRARLLRRRFNPKYQHLFSTGQSGVGIYDDSSEEASSSGVGAGLFSMLFDDVAVRPRKHYKFLGRRPPDNTEQDIEFQWAPTENSRPQLLSYTKMRPVVTGDNHLPKRLFASNERPENIYNTEKYRAKPHGNQPDRNTVIPGFSPNIDSPNRDTPIVDDILSDSDKTNEETGQNNNYLHLNGPRNNLPFTGMPGMEYPNRRKPIYETRVMPAATVANAEASAIGLSEVSDELGGNLIDENRNEMSEEHMHRGGIASRLNSHESSEVQLDLSISSDVEDTSLRTSSPETRMPHDNHERTDYDSRSKSTGTSDTSTLARAVVSEESIEYEKPSIGAKSSASATAASEASADTARFDDKESKDSINEVTGKESASSETITSDTVGQRKAEIGTISPGTLEERSKEDVLRNTEESWLPYDRKPIPIALEKSSLPESSKGNEGLSPMEEMFAAGSAKSIGPAHAIRSSEELAKIEEKKQEEDSVHKHSEEGTTATAVASAEADTNVLVHDYGMENEKIPRPNKVRPIINARGREHTGIPPISHRPLMRGRPTVPHPYRDMDDMYAKPMSNELDENMNFYDLMSIESDQHDLSGAWDEDFALTSVRDMFQQAMDKRIDVSSKKSRDRNLDYGLNRGEQLNEEAIARIAPDFSDTKSKGRNMFDRPWGHSKSLSPRYGKQWMPTMNLGNSAPGTHEKPASYENEAITTATADASASVDAHPEMGMLRKRPLKMMLPITSENEDLSLLDSHLFYGEESHENSRYQRHSIEVAEDEAATMASAEVEAHAVAETDFPNYSGEKLSPEYDREDSTGHSHGNKPVGIHKGEDVSKLKLQQSHSEESEESVRHGTKSAEIPEVQATAVASALSDTSVVLKSQPSNEVSEEARHNVLHSPAKRPNNILDLSHEIEDVSVTKTQLTHTEESHESTEHNISNEEGLDLETTVVEASAEAEARVVAEADVPDRLYRPHHPWLPHKPHTAHKPEDLPPLNIHPHPNDNSMETASASAKAKAMAVAEADVPDRMYRPDHSWLPHKPHKPHTLHKPEDLPPLKMHPHPTDNSMETASASVEAEAMAVAEADVPDRMYRPDHSWLSHKPHKPHTLHKPEDLPPLKMHPHPTDNSMETASASVEAEAMAVAEADVPDRMYRPDHSWLPHKPHKPHTPHKPHKPHTPHKPENLPPLKMHPHPTDNSMETASASAEAEATAVAEADVPDRMDRPHHPWLPHKPHTPHKSENLPPLKMHPHPTDNSMETVSASAETEAVAVAEADVLDRMYRPHHPWLPHKPHKPENLPPLKMHPHPTDNSMGTASTSAEAEAMAVAGTDVPDRIDRPHHPWLPHKPHKPHTPHKPEDLPPLKMHPHPTDNSMETASASAEAEAKAVAETDVPDRMYRPDHSWLPHKPHKPHTPHKPEDLPPSKIHPHPTDNSIETATESAEAEAMAVAETDVPNRMDRPHHPWLPHKPHKPHTPHKPGDLPPLKMHPHPTDNTIETASASAEAEAKAVGETDVPNRMDRPHHPWLPHKPEDLPPLKMHPHPTDNSMETASASAEAEAKPVGETDVPNRMDRPHHPWLPHKPHKPENLPPLKMHPHPTDNSMETASASAEAEAKAVAETDVPNRMDRPHHPWLPHKPHKPGDLPPLKMHPHPTDNSMETASASAEAEAMAVAETDVPDRMYRPDHSWLPHKPHKPGDLPPLKMHPHPSDNSMETASASAEAEAKAVAETDTPNRMDRLHHPWLPHKPHKPHTPHKPGDLPPLKMHPHPTDNSMETASASAEAEAKAVGETDVPNRMDRPHHPWLPHKPEDLPPLKMHPHPTDNSMETASASAEAEAKPVGETDVPNRMDRPHHPWLPHKPHKPENLPPLKMHPHPTDNSMETASASAEAEAKAVAETDVPNRMDRPHHPWLPHKPHKPGDLPPLKMHPHPTDNSMETASASAEAEAMAVAETDVPDRMYRPDHSWLPHKPHKPGDLPPLKMHPHPSDNSMETASASAEAEAKAVAETDTPNRMDRLHHPWLPHKPHKPHTPHKPGDLPPLKMHPHPTDNSMETASASAEAEAMAVAQTDVPDRMYRPDHSWLPHKPHKPGDLPPLKMHPHPSDNSMETASASAEAEAKAVAETDTPNRMDRPHHPWLPHKPHKPEDLPPLKMHPHPTDNSMETASASAEAEAKAVAETDTPNRMDRLYHPWLPHKPHKPHTPHKPGDLPPLKMHPHPSDNPMETASASAEAEAKAVAETDTPNRMDRLHHPWLPHKPHTPHKPGDLPPLKMHPHPTDNSMETASASAEAEAIAVAETDVPNRMDRPHHPWLPQKPYKPHTPHKSEDLPPLKMHPHPTDNSMETASASAEAEAKAVAETDTPNRMDRPHHPWLPHKPHKPHTPHKPGNLPPLKMHPHPTDNSMETASASAEAEAKAVAETDVPDRMYRPDHSWLPHKPHKPHTPHKPEDLPPSKIHPHPTDNSIETATASAEAEAMAVAEVDVPDKMVRPHHPRLPHKPHKPEDLAPLRIHQHPNDNLIETASASAEAEADAIVSTEELGQHSGEKYIKSDELDFMNNIPSDTLVNDSEEENVSVLKSGLFRSEEVLEENVSAFAKAKSVAAAAVDLSREFSRELSTEAIPLHSGKGIRPGKPLENQESPDVSPVKLGLLENEASPQSNEGIAEATATVEAESIIHESGEWINEGKRPIHPEAYASAEAEATAVAESNVNRGMGLPVEDSSNLSAPRSSQPPSFDTLLDKSIASHEIEESTVELPLFHSEKSHPRGPELPVPYNKKPLAKNAVETEVAATASVESDTHVEIVNSVEEVNKELPESSSTANAIATAHADASSESLGPRRIQPVKLNVVPHESPIKKLHEDVDQSMNVEESVEAKASASATVDVLPGKNRGKVPDLAIEDIIHPKPKDHIPNFVVQNSETVEAEAEAEAEVEINNVDNSQSKEKGLWDHIPRIHRPHRLPTPNHPNIAPLHEIPRENEVAEKSTATARASASVETDVHNYKPEHGIPIMPHTHGFNHPYHKDLPIENRMKAQSLDSIFHDDDLFDSSLFDYSTIKSGESGRDFSLFNMENDFTMSGFSPETRTADTLESGIQSPMEKIHRPKNHKIDVGIGPQWPGNSQEKIQTVGESLNAVIEDAAFEEKSLEEEYKPENTKLSDETGLKESTVAVAQSPDLPIAHLRNGLEDTAEAEVSIASSHIADETAHDRVRSNELANGNSVFTGKPHTPFSPTAIEADEADIFGPIKHTAEKPVPDVLVASVSSEALATVHPHSKIPESKIPKPKGSPIELDENGELHSNTEDRLGLLTSADIETIPHPDQPRNVPRRPYGWPEYERPWGGISKPKEIGYMVPSKELPTPKATDADAFTEAAGLGESSAPIESANVGRPVAPGHDDNRSWNIKNSASSENQSHDDESRTMEIETTEDMDTENVAIPSAAMPLAQAQAIASGKARASEQVSDEDDDHGIGRWPVPTPGIRSRWGSEEKPYYPESVSHENEVDDISKERLPGAISNRIQPNGSPDTIHIPSSPITAPEYTPIYNPHSVNDLPQVEDQAPFPPYLRAPNHYPLKDRPYTGRPNTPESGMMPPKKDWPFGSSMSKPCINCETADASSEAQATSHVDIPPNEEGAPTEVDTFASASANTAVQPNSGGPLQHVPDNSMKTDVYIVKRTKKGPVTVTHMLDSLPPLVEYRLIPRKIYDQVRSIISKHQAIHAGYSQTTSPLRLN